MMEKLLEMARKVSDQAEVYSADIRGDGISFENGHLKDIDSSMQYGLSLRIIKHNIQGFAYTKNLVHREELLNNAVDSLKGGVEGSFALPLTKEVSSLNTYHASIEIFPNASMVEECGRLCEFLSLKTKGQVNVSAHRLISRKRIINSSGTDLSVNSSAYIMNPQIMYPYSSASLHRTFASKTFQRTPDEYLNYLVDTYSRSVKDKVPEGTKMKVLFLPESVYVLMWRLQNATNGMSIYQKISPLEGKIGERLFDEKLSVWNDPLDDALPGARAFDDEGIPCRHFPVVEQGVLKNYYYDLYFGRKLGASPTGHGFRGSALSKPVPSLSHLSLSPGSASCQDLIRSMDRGIIVAGALGAHSGNIPNGDFSIGVSPAIYVEKGEIAGNVKDVMVAGNIYEVLKNILGIEDTLHPGYGGNFPALLFDNVNVTVKR